MQKFYHKLFFLSKTPMSYLMKRKILKIYYLSLINLIVFTNTWSFSLFCRLGNWW